MPIEMDVSLTVKGPVSAYWAHVKVRGSAPGLKDVLEDMGFTWNPYLKAYSLLIREEGSKEKLAERLRDLYNRFKAKTPDVKLKLVGREVTIEELIKECVS